MITKVNQAVIDWVQENYHTLMPEEVTMSLGLTSGNVFVSHAIKYLTSQLDLMQV